MLLNLLKAKPVNKSSNFKMNKYDAGIMLVLSSPSGAGKTTLLQLLGTLDKIQKGSIVINGKDIRSFSEKEVSKFRNNEIGFVFQFHNLLNEFTSLENICLPAYLNGTNKKEAEKKRVRTIRIIWPIRQI